MDAKRVSRDSLSTALADAWSSVVRVLRIALLLLRGYLGIAHTLEGGSDMETSDEAVKISLPGRLIATPQESLGSPGMSIPMKRDRLPSWVLYKTMRQVSLEAMQTVQGIPDYREPYRMSIPIAVETKDALSVYVIDGWPLVEEARAEGLTTVTCQIYGIRDTGTINVMLSKLSIRLLPFPGRVRYSEILRNIVILGQQLQPGEDPVLYGRGGDRKSPKFVDHHDEFRTTLAEWTERSVKTISGYIVSSAWLSVETLDMLARENCPRKFFAAIDQAKRELAEDLSASNGKEETTRQVSAAVEKWWRVYKERKCLPKAATKPNPDTDSPADEPSEDKPQSTESPRPVPAADEPASRHAFVAETGDIAHAREEGNQEGIDPEVVELQKCLTNLLNTFVGQNNVHDSLEKTAERVKDLIGALTSIYEDCGARSRKP
jgi:hypothetical protein